MGVGEDTCNSHTLELKQEGLITNLGYIVISWPI